MTKSISIGTFSGVPASGETKLTENHVYEISRDAQKLEMLARDIGRPTDETPNTSATNPYEQYTQVRFLDNAIVITNTTTSSNFRDVYTGSFVFSSDGTIASAFVENRYSYLSASKGLVTRSINQSINSPTLFSLGDLTGTIVSAKEYTTDADIRNAVTVQGLAPYFPDSWINQSELFVYNDSASGTGQGDIKTLIIRSYTSKSDVDPITNFDPKSQKIRIDSDPFGISGDYEVDFKIAKSSKQLTKLQKSDFNLVYNRKDGSLYYNVNREEAGFGDRGGLIAVLDPKLPLTSANFEIF